MADLSFCILRDKVVVNICDGTQLGHVIDINFNSHGQILGIIVPGDKKFIKSLSAGDSIFIPAGIGEYYLSGRHEILLSKL